MADTFPTPVPDPDDAQWWDALRGGQLTVARCKACEARWCRGLPRCPQCGSSDLADVLTSGEGTVYTWVTVHRALDPAFGPDIPYTVVVVDLDEGARVNGRLLTGAPRAGGRVKFAPYSAGGWRLVGFDAAPPGSHLGSQ